MGAERRRRAAEPMANEEWWFAHRPRGTGLGLHASVTASGAQCHWRGPRTTGCSTASVCVRELGTARLTWRRADDVVRGRADIQDSFV
jgi:hypothetical protein